MPSLSLSSHVHVCFFHKYTVFVLICRKKMFLMQEYLNNIPLPLHSTSLGSITWYLRHSVAPLMLFWTYTYFGIHVEAGWEMRGVQGWGEGVGEKEEVAILPNNIWWMYALRCLLKIRLKSWQRLYGTGAQAGASMNAVYCLPLSYDWSGVWEGR